MVTAAGNVASQNSFAIGRRKLWHGRVPARCSKGSPNRGIALQRCRTNVQDRTECVMRSRVVVRADSSMRTQRKNPSSGRLFILGIYGALRLLPTLSRGLPGLKSKPDQEGGSTIFPEVYYPVKWNAGLYREGKIVDPSPGSVWTLRLGARERLRRVRVLLGREPR